MFCLYFIISACGHRCPDSQLDLNGINYFQLMKHIFTLFDKHRYHKISSNLANKWHFRSSVQSFQLIYSSDIHQQVPVGPSCLGFISLHSEESNQCVSSKIKQVENERLLFMFFYIRQSSHNCPVVCPSSPLTLKDHWPYTRLNNKLEGGHRASRAEWASQLDSLRNQLFRGRAEIKQTLQL